MGFLLLLSGIEGIPLVGSDKRSIAEMGRDLILLFSLVRKHHVKEFLCSIKCSLGPEHPLCRVRVPWCRFLPEKPAFGSKQPIFLFLSFTLLCFWSSISIIVVHELFSSFTP